jgi:hypothetical protein
LVKALWTQQEGACHWCKRQTRLHDHPLYKRSTGALSGLAATLDHLYSKLHPLRHKSVDHSKYVMACSTCNGRRSKEECLAGMQKMGSVDSRAVRKSR